jgi:hypothetical protein
VTAPSAAATARHNVFGGKDMQLLPDDLGQRGSHFQI